MTVRHAPRRGRPPKPDRPLLIADAVLRVLAEEGSKGLSHRRVDREAKLPIGSTVHHAPARSDLFAIASNRLHELNMSDLSGFAASLEGCENITLQILAHHLVEFWRRLVHPDHFYRLKAEMAVLFAQEFRHDVYNTFKPQMDETEKLWARVFSMLGVINPAEAAMEFTLWNRGIFSIVAACEGDLQEHNYTMIEKWIIQMINSFPNHRSREFTHPQISNESTGICSYPGDENRSYSTKILR